MTNRLKVLTSTAPFTHAFVQRSGLTNITPCLFFSFTHSLTHSLTYSLLVSSNIVVSSIALNSHTPHPSIALV